MQAPPVPSAPPPQPPEPQEEMPPMKLELPRFTQPSPSLIPRKARPGSPNSARASPDGRIANTNGGVSLNSKASYSSLLNSSASTSRLPTPKPRNVHSSSAQYGEDEEMVPPVPAIPKAFESPRDEFPPPVASRKSSQSGIGVQPDFSSEFDMDVSFPTSLQQAGNTSRLSQDRSKPHQRMNTIENIERSINMASSARQAKAQAEATGRKNNNLQPLRLPPLNLMPITQSVSNKGSHLPRPSQEIESRDDYNGAPTTAQTPEPKRVPKTPSTPMTASKAMFNRRADEDLGKQQMRSSSSHYALRDLVHMDDDTLQFFDDTDADNMGVPVPPSKQRSAITPFSSGSLPKGSGEFLRQRARPSADFGNDHTWSHFENFISQTAKPQGPRPSRSGTKDSFKTAETSSSIDSPVAEQGSSETKKESSGGGLRRKLSLGWRRSTSKASTHPDNKSSPQQDASATEKEKTKLQKRISQMPPPKLPASATWTGDIPSVPTNTTRPSLDSLRRKSTNASTHSLANVQNSSETDVANPTTPSVKTKSIHTEQPQPVSAASRATSWSASSSIRPVNPKVPPPGVAKARQAASTPTLSALVKDKDDIAADDEMRRLSQKRKDVDSAARESEELRKRAVARSPLTPDRVLHDRSCNLNIFERGEIMDYGKDGIYFTGTKNARKIIGSLTPSPTDGKDKAGNYGYDDERGDYNIVLGDHLAYRYEVVDVLGKGSFGQVVRCVDHRDGGVVAIKIIRNKKRFHQQALVEVGILGRLRDWVSATQYTKTFDMY